jgi:hypothetical protein
LNGSLPYGILEPLRNNSVCHKWPQAGSGPAKSIVSQFPMSAFSSVHFEMPKRT